jgi:hypothetical protein
MLRRAGAASPLLPAIAYSATVLVTGVALRLVPDNVAVALLSVLLWLGASLFLFVVVTWYRDDDWLAAGFLVGMTVVAGGWLADVLTQVLFARSLMPAIVSGPTAFFGVAARAIIAVPVSGGIVALARWITRPRVPIGPPPMG